MSEILSREEFDDEFLRVCRPSQQLYDTIRALAEALKMADGCLNSDLLSDDELPVMMTMLYDLRKKGWL